MTLALRISAEYLIRLLESECLNDTVNQMHDELQQEEEEGGRLDIGKIPKTRSFATFKREFHMADSCDFAVNAMKVRPATILIGFYDRSDSVHFMPSKAVVEDEVTRYFSASG